MTKMRFLCAVAFVMLGSLTNAVLIPNFLVQSHKNVLSVPASDQKKTDADATGFPVDASSHSCLQTNDGITYPWWAVEMDYSYAITEVEVNGYSIMEDGEIGAGDFIATAAEVESNIDPGTEPDGPSFKRCVGTRHKLSNGMHMTCEPGFHGRYLYIYLNVAEIMVLCEVTIGIVCPIRNCHPAHCYQDGLSCQHCADGYMLEYGECRPLNPCQDFQEFANERADGGELRTGIYTATDCKDACRENDSCTGVDIDYTDGEPKCWLHMSPITVLTPDSNAEHYRRVPCER